VDVIVVGAGIVGLTCALLLAESGYEVAVLEADAIAAGVSGYTTAKLTAGHGLLYHHLESSFGHEAAARYAQAQTAGLAHVRQLCDRHSVDCNLESVANYVFAENEDEMEQLEKEASAAVRAGLAAEVVYGLDVPFPAVGAVVLPDQAQLHPRLYLLAIASLVQEAGGSIVEGHRVVAIEGEAAPFTIRTRDGKLQAHSVVVATHYPIVDQGFFATRIHPRRSYVVAAPLADDDLDGMFINVGTPTRSIRTTPLPDGRRLLLVGGEGHRVGQKPENAAPYDVLADYLDQHFSTEKVGYRWSTQDNFSVDRLPYVGPASDAEGIYVATGFAGWGMTNGTAAALSLAAAVQGQTTRWSELFDLRRTHLRASVKRFVSENVNVGVQQVKGARPAETSLEDVEPGAGAILSIDGRDAAVSRRMTGELQAVSASCTHMGCTVAWNKDESTWDCPCHGSRFAPDGTVLHGPALEPLELISLASETK
jgi:glycine/D-amino acid oxidase-like deaminating enzyme/nitrite reductase/ring-hydroxylating ferredoxin subunit